jgi:endonuclease III
MTRLGSLIAALERFYGSLPSPPRDPFRLFVWDVLSARSTLRKRNAAFGALTRIRALTPDSLWRAPQKKLEESVALAGPYLEQRLGALKGGADRFRRAPGLARALRGPLGRARRALRGLPQIGSGGARRMLLFAADHPVLPMDSAVTRVALRLGYGEAVPNSARRARIVRAALMGELTHDAGALRRAFVYLSNHGAATCTESDPHCAICPLRPDCPYGRERSVTS